MKGSQLQLYKSCQYSQPNLDEVGLVNLLKGKFSVFNLMEYKSNSNLQGFLKYQK
ncbi:unnamed protein product [Paramecium sonneborni]|uniref:Uncharacterized protein n=1 Tax=Paramecium sonneborni TaxID=65129 RepID=A0A8S1NTR3_9CILI|nr:unnamed protein product [Paramecium sonneborni]